MSSCIVHLAIAMMSIEVRESHTLKGVRLRIQVSAWNDRQRGLIVNGMDMQRLAALLHMHYGLGRILSPWATLAVVAVLFVVVTINSAVSSVFSLFQPPLTPAQQAEKLVKIGIGHFADNEFKEALVALDRASATDPSSTDPYLWRGTVYKAQGRKSLARSEYIKMRNMYLAAGKTDEADYIQEFYIDR